MNNGTVLYKAVFRKYRRFSYQLGLMNGDFIFYLFKDERLLLLFFFAQAC